MKCVVQKVSSAKVCVEGKTVGNINSGLLVLAGFKATDNTEIVKWMCNKLANLRVFKDEEEKLNRSVLDIQGEILIISNFTLYGDVQRGFRPSFTEAANSQISEPIYNEMVDTLRNNYPIKVETGIFGAMMEVSLLNDGPVTIIIEKD